MKFIWLLLKKLWPEAKLAARVLTLLFKYVLGTYIFLTAVGCATYWFIESHDKWLYVIHDAKIACMIFPITGALLCMMLSTFAGGLFLLTMIFSIFLKMHIFEKLCELWKEAGDGKGKSGKENNSGSHDTVLESSD
jgi:hypothetical protein